DALELDALARVVAGGLLEIVDETLLAVGDAGVVLDVLRTGVSLDCLGRAALIEHQVVESDHIPFVAFRIAHADLPACAPDDIIRRTNLRVSGSCAELLLRTKAWSILRQWPPSPRRPRKIHGLRPQPGRSGRAHRAWQGSRHNPRRCPGTCWYWP